VLLNLRGDHVFFVFEDFWFFDDWFWLFDSELEFRITVVMEASARWDEVTHDDVFFESGEVIDTAKCRSLGKDTGGSL
jgi:hypothetical protein